MRITQTQFDPLSMLSQSDAAYPRSTSRLHVSQVYQSINDSVGKRKANKFTESELDAYRSMGFLYEHFLAQAMAVGLGYEGWFRPGEVECDNIVGSPDLISAEDGSLGECKATYKSFNRMTESGAGLRDEFWIWDVQMRAYCKMLGTRTATLYALFVNGDYKTYQPWFRRWQVEYTVQDIEENWIMIKQHARSKGWL